MFGILRWIFITLVTIAIAIGLAFGFKQLQNKYYPAFQGDRFVKNDFRGNVGDLNEAIENAMVLLEKRQHIVFLTNYIPEEGKAMFIKAKKVDKDFVRKFEESKADIMLSVLKQCVDQNYEKSNETLKGVCTLKEKFMNKDKMIFMKQKGSWRIDN